jgi:tetratricopeptide (TPR) repeat protein
MQQCSIDQAMQIAMAAHEAGRLVEAETIYRQVLERQSNHARAIHLLGVIAQQCGKPESAVALIERSIAIDPTDKNAHSNLSLALREQGLLERAAAAAMTAVRLDPNWAISQNNLGVCLSSLGRFDEAAAVFRRALALRPDWAACLVNLGGALNEAGQFSEALPLLRKGVEALPNSPTAWNNLGNSLRDLGALDEAVVAYGHALRIESTYADAHNNLGMARNHQGDFQCAVASCTRSVELDPNSARGHMNLGIMLLRLGDFERGWAEYGWRKKLLRSEEKKFSSPQWDGANLAGRTILLHGEQGFGDVIQFVRYAPLVGACGAKVIVYCKPELSRLLTGLPGVEVVAEGEPLPAFDVHCPILDLPRVFNTRLNSIPAFVPYLSAPPELSLSWRTQFSALPRQVRVGLAWAGRPTHPEDRRRSIRLSQLDGLASNGVTFFSLQKGPAAQQAVTAPPGMKLVDCSENLQDFADTAAMIHHLDLIITVDTAVAHLAGAMGKPVWVLLPFVADWRWLRDREDSPWYPTMRLFRQQHLGDWAGVFSRVADALDTFMENEKPGVRLPDPIAWADAAIRQVPTSAARTTEQTRDNFPTSALETESLYVHGFPTRVFAENTGWKPVPPINFQAR